MILGGAKVVTPDGVLDDGWVRVEGERIAGVGSGPVDGESLGGYVVPGFVDMHCHGGGGADFAEATPERVGTAVRTHRARGTTSMLASLVSAPIEVLTGQLTALAPLVEEGLIAGVHLEGPFISDKRRGAHNPAALRDPEPDAVRALLAAGGSALRMLTIAPERAGAIAAIELAAAEGVTVALGHTDAVEEQVRAGIEAGARVATHLFNGMRPLHHREPGPIGALLDDERVAVELICDLVHLAPTTIHLSATHAGRARTVLITDAMSAAELGDGDYELGGLAVTVTEGEPRLPDGSLAGSVLTMDRAFANFVRSGMPITEAVQASSTLPAQLLGLGEVGAIAQGRRADLVLLDEDLRLRRVLHRGSWV
ncbi:N-acetylglucosamine-6-phosphate deacetylase [Sciscionella marina]|uniref:N-acetylglucosamine-6-phosphate deacetylase n=1 Tax=Sciscionella marina TaxID=508770 RepID=UPI000371F23F|nr:N-acetylglucosamine-6-phosphate deacetylase [Sciscionella marina]